jgi:hypothetical protein
MKRAFLCLTMVGLISVLSCGAAWAQATAQISGTARDQSGAVLPGVDITATQTETGITRTTVTNETGLYVLPNLAIGSYKLEAGLPGFRTFVQTGLVLQVNSSPVVNVVLEVGQISEQVEVQANAALVETRSSSVGQVVENARILDLPLNGRNVADLITLGGAAVQTDIPMPKNFAGSNYISAAGGLGFGVEYTLDGARHVNFVSGTSMQMPFPDALQELKIETSGMTANHGVSAAVGGVTKSGTNDIHGDLFEFVRNDLFNARSYFATKSSTLKRNQFGGTVGGPILKNKLFFFAGYQGTITRQDPSDARSFIPTAAMMAGDWTAFASPACNTGRQIALRAPFVNNRIDPAQYNKVAVNILNRVLPKTPTPDACGQVTYGLRNVSDEKQMVGRVDYQWTMNHAIFGRFVRNTLDNPPAYESSPNNILTASGVGYLNTSNSIAFGDTYLIGPNIVQSFRAGANIVDVWRIGNAYFSYCDVGVKTYCGYAPTYTNFSITGGFGLSSNNVDDNKYHPHTYSFNDDVSIVRGNHQYSLGGGLTHGNYTSKSDFVAAGTMTFNGQDTGLGMGDFMLGKVSSLVMGTPNDQLVLTQNSIAMYATDTWKIKPKVTLNYGLRWEPYIPQVMSQGSVLNFSEDRFHQGIRSTVYKNAPLGWYYPGDPGAPTGNSVANKKWAQFAPRAGFAWDVNGDGKTSVRMSYAYSYNFVNAQWREDTVGSAPWGNRTSITSVTLDDPWATFPGGIPFPLVKGAEARFSAYSNMQSTPFDVKTPTTSSWNLSVQRQLGPNWMLSASYIGTETSHIWSQKALNPAIFIPGNCQAGQFGLTAAGPCSTTANTNQRRRFSLERPVDGQLMAFVSDTDAGGTQSYNGMLLSVQRQAGRGITVNTNYTWSHCIGDYADVNSQGPAADETYSNPTNRRADRGDCLGERRQTLNFTGLAETPRFANNTLRIVASGWRLSGIYTRSSGAPFTVITGSDRSLTSTGLGSANNQRANQVLGDPYKDRSGRPLTTYLNPAAFALPALGTVGNVGRNTVRGLPTWSFDMALSRSLPIRETQRIELRFEAFNVTNSFRPGSIATQGTSGSGAYLSLATNTFGQVRNALDPRILQFALKYVF